jgi:hypothetical protein
VNPRYLIAGNQVADSPVSGASNTLPSPPAVRDCVFEQIVFAVVGEYALNCTHLRTD